MFFKYIQSNSISTKSVVIAIIYSTLLLTGIQNFTQGQNFTTVSKDEPHDSIIVKAARIVPSPRQFEWQQLETTAFLHFTINTFTDREWGDGTESPGLFNPTRLNARQWVRVCKKAGMKLIIITAKHHDGFCLWPSKYTGHSVKNSPWKNGKGDVMHEIAEACRKENIRFGFYLSPWDRHEKTYGNSPEYNNYFLNQLRELLTNYGKIWEVWFDGACGEGPNGKRQVYDWAAYYSLIRELQPDACIAVMGPDVRWVGTESGYGRDTEWSVVPVDAMDQVCISENSQHTESESGFIPPGNMMDHDLGSREKLKDAKMLIWYPSEVDVSIRPGWFWHQKENSQVKSPEKLFDIYLNSVGKNSVLLLNIPPDNRGLINKHDIQALKGYNRLVKRTFQRNLLSNAMATIDGVKNPKALENLTDKEYETHWPLSKKERLPEIIFELKKEVVFDKLVIQEYIKTGQKIEKFSLYYWKNKQWEFLQSATTVGYKRILSFGPVLSSKIKLIIEESRAEPDISMIGLFKTP